MKILFISYDFPYPPTGGSISRDYNLIKQLSLYHELYWINRTITGKVNQEYIDEMKKYFVDMRLIFGKYKHSILKFVKSIFTRLPYIIYRFSSAEMKSAVNESINENNFDLILCDHIYLAQFIPEEVVGKIPVIPNNEDSGFNYYKKMSEKSKSIRKIYASVEWKRMLRYEVGILKKFGVYITTSEEEKKLISKHYDKAEICVVNNGVDTEYFKKQEREDYSPNAVFTAWFKYYPNVDAAIYFAEKIYPAIKARIPEFKFYIVGKNPPEKIKSLESINGIHVTGYVEDVREYFKNADAAVIPLRIGGGTRLKILEAMSMEIPVVSTKPGAEGLCVSNGENILISDNETDFSDNVVRLISDKILSGYLTVNGRKLVEEVYDWKIAGTELNNFINNYVNNFRKRI